MEPEAEKKNRNSYTLLIIKVKGGSGSGFFLLNSHASPIHSIQIYWLGVRMRR